MKLLVTAAIFLFCSCKVTDKNLLGKYAAKSYHRSTIILDSNNQFRYWSDGLELAFNNKSFLSTKGTWIRTQRNKLILNSTSDSIAIPPFEIRKQKIKDSDKSRFTFFDQNADSLLIYMIYKNGDAIFYRSHGPYLTSFEDTVSKLDTLTFTFTFGYDPIKIPIATVNSAHVDPPFCSC